MKHIVKFWKNSELIGVELCKSKKEALDKKRKYLQSFHMTQKVKENRQATISKA